MESENTERQERAKASRRRSHKKWAQRHPKRMRQAQKRWRGSEVAKSGDRRKKAVERSRRVALAALDKAGTYVVLRPDGGTTTLFRHPDGTWEVLP